MGLGMRLYVLSYTHPVCRLYCHFLKLTVECPPVLFEARSRSDLGISFGGVPSVYLHNGVPTSKSIFHIRSLHSRQLVNNIIIAH